MTFIWKDFIDTANDILVIKKVPDEGISRTSINRYYYACFGTAKNLLTERGTSFQHNRLIHRQIIEHFKLSKNVNKQNVGGFLEQLYDYRIKVDYHNNCGFDLKNTAELCKLSANYIIKELSEIFGQNC